MGCERACTKEQRRGRGRGRYTDNLGNLFARQKPNEKEEKKTNTYAPFFLAPRPPLSGGGHRDAINKRRGKCLNHDEQTRGGFNLALGCHSRHPTQSKTRRARQLRHEFHILILPSRVGVGGLKRGRMTSVLGRAVERGSTSIPRHSPSSPSLWSSELGQQKREPHKCGETGGRFRTSKQGGKGRLHHHPLCFSIVVGLWGG